MMIRFRPGAVLLPAFALGVAAWVGLAISATPEETPSLEAGPMTTGFRPLDYFQNQCARCHGDYGAAYGKEFGKNLDDKQLEGFVRDMAEGPAQAPLGDADLVVETGFQRALRDGQPFGVVVAWKNGVLSGEATPGSKVSLSVEGRSIEIPLEGDSWKVSVPTGTAWKTALVHIRKDGKETAIPLGKRAF